MSLGVSVTDPLFQALKLTETTGNDSLTTSTTTATAATTSAESSVSEVAPTTIDGLALREKTNFLRGKLSSHHRRPGEGSPSSPLASLSKIDDAHLAVSSTGKEVEIRSLSWPSAHAVETKTTVDGGEGDDAERRSSVGGGVVDGKPSSWPCSPLVKPGALFNKDTTFKEGLGVPINYAEGRNSLTHVLESIQLCYNPASKQLHRLQAEEGPLTIPSSSSSSRNHSNSSSSTATASTADETIDQRTSQPPMEVPEPSQQQQQRKSNAENDNLDCDISNESRSKEQSSTAPPWLGRDLDFARAPTEDDVTITTTLTDVSTSQRSPVDEEQSGEEKSDFVPRSADPRGHDDDVTASVVDESESTTTMTTITTVDETVVEGDIRPIEAGDADGAAMTEELDAISNVKIDPDDIITSLRLEGLLFEVHSLLVVDIHFMFA